MAPPEEDPHKDVHGVLLSDEIFYYVKNHNLIEPFEEKNLKPASYNLTLGDQYSREGVFSKLDERNPAVEIRPHEAVLIQTKEILRLPRHIIGRWNPRVSMIFNGLVWVGGVHIDPGWEGQLWCPVYNLSKKAIKLHRGDSFASVDFVKTTPFTKNVSKEYQKGWDVPHHPGSGLEEVRVSVDKFRTELDSYQGELGGYRTRLEGYQSITFAVLGVVIAAVTIIASGPFLRTPPSLPFPDWTVVYLQVLIGISVASFAMSLIALFWSRRNLDKVVKKASVTTKAN